MVKEKEIELSDEEIKLLEEEVEYILQLQIFGSPGGKTRVSEKIVSYIPEHKIYAEPFAGGAAVYFKKDPCEKEVLNDKNPEIAFAYNFIKNITTEQLNRLKQMDWNPSKSKFFKLRDAQIPKDPVQRFYRFYYVLIYSYGLSSKTYGYFVKNKFHIEKRVDKLKARLKNTEIYSTDYLEVLRKYNTPDTFAFLDPPYPNEWPGPEGTKLWTKEHVIQLHDFLKNEFKGKFMITLNSLDWIRKIFKDFKLFKLMVPRTFHHGDEAKFELIVTNYDIKSQKKELEEDKEIVYKKWKKLVNMTEKELKDFYESEEGKNAGLTKEEADKEGIKSGRESAKWIIEMLPISNSFAEASEKWTNEMWKWAKRQNSFISRMKGVVGPLYDERGNKTRKHLSLLIWGHDPTKKQNAETGSGDLPAGLQPAWIWGYKKKKKKLETDKGELEETTQEELIKDLKNYDPSKVSNEILEDDMRIVFAWYSTYKESDGKDIKFSYEDIVNIARLIYNEIEKRKEEGKLKHEWNIEGMRPNSKELFNIISQGKINKELIDNPSGYDTKGIPNEVLANDWRIICSWYSIWKDSNGKDIAFKKEEIVSAAKKIYDEIVKREESGEMEHEFKPEQMKPNSLDLYRIISRQKLSEVTEDIEKLKPFLEQFGQAIIIKDFISLVGSRVKRQEDHEPNDYDLHLRMDKDKIADYLERAVKVRLLKMVDEPTADKIHIFSGDASGGHDSFVPVYDLALVPSQRKIINMEESKEKIELMRPYLPEKPAGSAYYDLDKLIEKLKKW